MALAQHSSLEVRFEQQVNNAREYLLPFIEGVVEIKAGVRILEIGCGEGGVLRPFMEKGAQCVGVDLNTSRIKTAGEMLLPEVEKGLVDLRVKNVYDEDFQEEFAGAFDLIMLKDTIEHIPGQAQFIPYLRRFLKPNGHIFFGFPPWRMPFGGHQQICQGRFLSKLPYYHLLPAGLYKAILKAGGEPEKVINELLEIQECGISLGRFERIIKKSEMKVVHKRLYLFNPIYRYKFGLKPRVQASWVAALPWVRDFVTTAGWYVVQV